MLRAIMDRRSPTPLRAQISAMEVELKARRLSVAHLCRVADLNQTTWGRWKLGTPAKGETWERVVDAYDRLIASHVVAVESEAA